MPPLPSNLEQSNERKGSNFAIGAVTLLLVKKGYLNNKQSIIDGTVKTVERYKLVLEMIYPFSGFTLLSG